MADSWLARGIRMIEALDAQLPEGMALDDRKRAIQAEAWRFHGGTSWGQKVWPKAKRAFFAKRYGEKPRAISGIPEGHMSPMERLMANAQKD